MVIKPLDGLGLVWGSSRAQGGFMLCGWFGVDPSSPPIQHS